MRKTKPAGKSKAEPMFEKLAAELAASLCAAHDFSTPGRLWIGIAGPPGAGKTTLVAALVAALQARGVASVGIPMDGYHLTRAELDRMPDPAAAHRFRGAPFTFDGDRFVRDVREARRAGAFSFPGFDHAAGDPVADAHPLQASSSIVLVEGNYLLLDEKPWSELPACFDETWFLQCSLPTAKRRLAARHMAAWDWPLEKAMERVEDNDARNMVLIAQSPGVQRCTRVIDVDDAPPSSVT
jgi:pantothenate kinase